MLALLASGCPGTPKEPSKPTGGLRLDVDPPEARVWVNDKLFGTASTWEGRVILLGPGTKRLKLAADGYYTEYREIEVVDEVVLVEVSLTPVPEPLGVALP